MNNLFTQKRPLLRGRYEGKAIYVRDLLGEPIIVDHFEIAPSRHNKGKDMLVAQVMLNGERRVLFTESYSLISTLRETRDSPPYATKIVRKQDGYLYFVKLNKVELNKLEGYVRVEN